LDTRLSRSCASLARSLMKPFSLGELAATLGAVLGDAVASAAA
jgi:hypothetical protein